MANQPIRRAPQKRTASKKRKKNKRQSYLYIAVFFVFVAMAIATAIICIMAGCEGDVPDVSYESEQGAESSQEVLDCSVPESVPDVSEQSTPESSLPEESTPSKSPTEAYEDYIGVKYAIDMTEFEQYVCPENEKDFVYLVNPSHTLAADYVPPNLVKCTNIRKGRPESYSYIDATANKALEAFLAEAAYYGYDDITVTNAYRSYKTQAGLFSNYLKNDLATDYKCDTCQEYIDISYFPNKIKKLDCCKSCKGELTEVDGEIFCATCMAVAEKGQKVVCATCNSEVRRPTEEEATAHVLTYSTRPGTSEHQSGLCCDMHNLPETTSKFDNTPEAKWLAENAHRFGFILRYPPNTQHITGIKHESWHFRYVGRTAATEMYEKGLTLDEYCKFCIS